MVERQCKLDRLFLLIHIGQQTGPVLVLLTQIKNQTDVNELVFLREKQIHLNSESEIAITVCFASDVSQENDLVVHQK